MAGSKLYLGEEAKERFDTAYALHVAFERLKLQVDKESDKRRRTKKGDLVKEFADRINVAESTIGNWTSTKRIPARVEEIQFVSLVYLLARRTREVDVDWLVDVFRNSDRELPDNPSKNDIQELFRLARIDHQPVAGQEIDAAIQNLLDTSGNSQWPASPRHRNSQIGGADERNRFPLPPLFPEKPKRGAPKEGPRTFAYAVVVIVLIGIVGGAMFVQAGRGKKPTGSANTLQSPGLSSAAAMTNEEQEDKPAIYQVQQDWCTTHAAYVGSEETSRGARVIRLYVSTQVVLDDYYVYFDDEYVGPDSLELQGVDVHRDDWRFLIRDKWLNVHTEWEDETLWRIDFYCP